MDQDREFQPSPIEGLSVELVRMILSGVQDVPSLHAAVVSSPLFYRAFWGAETDITTQVLLSQIDSSVLPEAIAASESSLLSGNGSNGQATLDFITQNLSRRPTPPRAWSLPEALRLGRLHIYVVGLAKKFAMAVMNEPTFRCSDSVITSQEISRIERALYRFEIYCNLFRKSTPTRVQPGAFDAQNQLFFASFAPWENEQLGCVHDFLARIVSPAFDEIAENEMDWDLSRVGYDSERDSIFIQYILSLGLGKMYQIAEADTDEERDRLLYSYRHPSATYRFLHKGLQNANLPDDNIVVDDLVPEDGTLLIKPPFFADPDSGPVDAWRLSHQEETRANWVYQGNRHHLRRWGYVMWDRSRLKTSGIFGKSREDVDSSDS